MVEYNILYCIVFANTKGTSEEVPNVLLTIVIVVIGLCDFVGIYNDKTYNAEVDYDNCYKFEDVEPCMCFDLPEISKQPNVCIDQEDQGSKQSDGDDNC